MEEQIKIDNAVLDLIPDSYALEHTVLPLAMENGNLKVGMTDAGDFNQIRELMLLTGKNIIPVSLPEAEIFQAIARHYQVKIPKSNGRRSIKEFRVVDKIRESYKEKSEAVDDVSVINHINEIITKAVNEGASDIHFEPYEKRFRVRYRLDGRLHETFDLSLEKKFAYISRLKIMAELDIAEKRRPQDGRIRMEGGSKVIDIRVSTLPTDFGEKVVLRLLDKSTFKLDMDNIGFTNKMRAQFEDLLESPYGMILVTGPTGSGKTTTLYTALSFLNKADVNIMTIEDPIEYNLDGINQGHVRSDIGFSFAKALRSFLRQDPDIIMVGEIRDGETAEIAIRSALTGHLVLSTLHTNDAASAITRLTDMGIEPFLVATSLKMVMAQRLVRRICQQCKQEIKPDERMIQRLNLNETAQARYFKGAGCDNCNGTGYSGRTAVIEMLPVNDDIAGLIINGESASTIRRAAIKIGMLTLREHCVMKLEEGVTTIEELIRETMI